MVTYEDVAAAIGWLRQAFGFEESGERFTDDEGRVTHAELSLDGATVMLGWPGADYRSPKGHAQECDQAARWLATPWVIDGVHVEVDDVDAHYERAQTAGATILRGPEDRPFGRLYSAADLEGHRWMFMEA
jgi:uncharacterized glyoxalase superfamily protein PhnB